MSASVDPSSVTMLEEVGSDRFLEWTRGVDLCLPNLEEGVLLTGFEDPERVAEKLLSYYPGVVLKLGPGGAQYASAEGERVRLPSASTRVVDTTGAGDALCAGFLAAWLSGAPPAGALRRAVELAAQVVEQVGGRAEP
jgi:sugar/nucleoside kinase (ribokinase family)